MTTSWSTYEKQGYTVLLGENEHLAVHIVPERGSRIVSLMNKHTGRDWILNTDRPWESQNYGMPWYDGDRGGWDEMFPTINACACPDKHWKDVTLPDHGEVWCIPWEYRLEGEALHLSVQGVQLPYRLSKKLTLNGDTLQIDYQVKNVSNHSISYVWAAHPLLHIQPGMQFITPSDCTEIEVAYSYEQRLGQQGDIQPFPIATANNGERLDLSILEDRTSLAAEKYFFTPAVTEGYAGLSDPATGEQLTFHFDPNDNPYLAAWADYGGHGSYTFAIEPASGANDSVYAASQLGKVKQVHAHAVNTWSLRVSLASTPV